MGIGVSYTGNGEHRTFELEGVPSEGSMAAAVLGAHHSPTMSLPGMVPMSLPEVPKIPSLSDDAEAGKVKVTDGDIPDVLSRKMMPNGSVVANGNSICLRGEEGGVPGGRRVYSSVDGMKGFFSPAQIDPYGGGMPLIGTGDSPEGSEIQLDGKSGASIRLGGRSHISVDVDAVGNRWLVVKDFYRIADLSPYGRVVRVSKEIEVVVLRTLMGGGGSGNGKYCVRAFASGDDEKPAFNFLAFGTEADLDTWDEDEGKFMCNYDNGTPLANPPVKIAMVDTCDCPTIDSGG